jgi:hypothetical protein
VLRCRLAATKQARARTSPAAGVNMPQQARTQWCCSLHAVELVTRVSSAAAAQQPQQQRELKRR